MTQDEIFEMARESELGFLLGDSWLMHHEIEYFAKLVAEAERKKLQGQIETLHAMYELASKQRDALMDEQRAQVAAMRGRIQ
jgi:hypothetical protein